MKTKLLALLFLVGSAAFAGPRVVVGVGVGVGPAYGYSAPPAPALLTLLPRRSMWGPTFTMVLAGLARAIMDRVTTDLASTAVVITAVTGAGN